MNLTKNITIAAALLVAGASYAQTATSSSNGLLGQRYTEFNFGVQDLRHVSNSAYSLGAGVNAPITPGALDVGALYNYNWIGGSFKGHANTLATYATAYTPLNGVKPFFTGAFGWQWTSTRFVGRDDQGIWALATGVEIPAGAVTITPRITYADDFEKSINSSQEWTYAVEANYWVNAKTGVYASIGKTDVRRSPVDSWNYEIGLRMKF